MFNFALSLLKIFRVINFVCVDLGDSKNFFN